MADAVLTLEARLLDQISKRLDSIEGNLSSFSRKGTKSVGLLQTSFDKLQRIASKPIGAGGLFKDLMKFAGLKSIFNQLEQSVFKIFEAVQKNNPKVAAQFETLKTKVNSLVTEIAEKVAPILEKFFDWLIKNWDRVRYVFAVGGAVIQDTFYGILGGFQVMVTGVLQGAAWIAKGLAMVGIVSDETAEDFDQAATQMAESAAANFAKIGKTAQVLQGGVSGIGKFNKTTAGLFGGEVKKSEIDFDSNGRLKKERDIMKRDEEEQRRMIEEENEFKKKATRAGEDAYLAAMEEGVEKRLAVSAMNEERLKQEWEQSKLFSILSAQEKQDLLTAIEEEGTQERIRITEEESKKKMEAYRSAGKDFVNNLEFIATNNKRQTLAMVQNSKQYQQADSETRAKMLKDAENKTTAFGKLYKASAKVQALTDTYTGAGAAFKALAGIPVVGPALGAAAAAAAVVAGLARVQQIDALKLKEGTPFFPGRNTMVQVNDGGGGQEALLNGRATNTLGVGRINALNNGNAPTQHVVNEIHYSPTNYITTQGGGTVSIVEALNKDKETFFTWFDQQKRKGFAT